MLYEKEKTVCAKSVMPENLSAVLVDNTKEGHLIVKLLGETTREKAIVLLSEALEKLREK